MSYSLWPHLDKTLCVIESKIKVECGKEESIYLRGQGEPQRYEDRS